MSPAWRMVVALIGGLAIGVAASEWSPDNAGRLLVVAEPVGTLWLNALRMTLIPLVVALLIGGIASASDTGATGRLGLRALLVFLALLGGIGVMSALVAPPLLALLPLDPSTSAALREGAGEAARDAARMPTFAQMIADIVPPNPIRAAADGAMLPLVTFAVALGFAAARLPGEERGALVGFFRAIGDGMLVIVAFVIRIAPIGVFALAVVLAVRIGTAAAGVIAFYVALLTGLVVVATVVLYPIAAIGGRIPIRRFARAVAPAQTVAFSARSSMAALPALVDAARTQLALPPAVTSFVFPLASSTLRISTPIMWAVTIPFLARLYGIDVPFAQLVWLIGVGILLSFSTPGLPSASLFLMAPFLTGLGIPPDALGIAIAADAIPDIFKSVQNVTGHMAAAVITARAVRPEAAPALAASFSAPAPAGAPETGLDEGLTQTSRSR